MAVLTSIRDELKLIETFQLFTSPEETFYIISIL